jgi:hypothetical protein
MFMADRNFRRAASDEISFLGVFGGVLLPLRAACLRNEFTTRQLGGLSFTLGKSVLSGALIFGSAAATAASAIECPHPGGTTACLSPSGLEFACVSRTSSATNGGKLNPFSASAVAQIVAICLTVSTGYFPAAVSPLVITASVPSKIAFATSLTSARVGTWIRAFGLL